MGSRDASNILEIVCDHCGKKKDRKQTYWYSATVIDQHYSFCSEECRTKYFKDSRYRAEQQA